VIAQNGTGGLNAPVFLTPTQTAPMSLVLADIDRDGALDITVAGNSGIEWIRQGPGGTLANQGLLGALSGSQFFLEASDLDGDGATDLVSLNTSGGIAVLTHGAGSTFTATTIPNTTPPLNPIDLAVGDVDGDGRGDVVYAGGGGVRVHHNTAGGWTITDHPGVAPSFVNISSEAVADVTGDGRPDIIATNLANSPGGVVDVWAQNSNGTLAAAVMYDAGQIPQAVAADDFNGDGRKDVVVINNAWAGVTFLLQQANGTLAPKQTVGIANKQHPDGHGLAFGDLNGDTQRDVVAVGDTNLTIIGQHPIDHKDLVQLVVPAEYSTSAALASTPSVVFTNPANPSTVNSTTVHLVDGRTGATLAGPVFYNVASQTATITPSAALHRANPYRIVVDGVLSASGNPVRSMTSTFTTTGTGSLSALQNFAVRGQLGAAASVSYLTPIGDLGDVVVRYAPGPTPPATPTSGTPGYTGVGGGIMIGGLTPGQTYSFSVWYHDRNGNLSPQSTATLIGTTLTMTGTSAAPGAGTADVTFTGTVTTPSGAGVGVPVPLVAYCAEGPFAGTTVATGTGDGSGLLSTILTLGSPRCSYRWEITNTTQYMGDASAAVRVSAGPNPPPGQTPPRDR